MHPKIEKLFSYDSVCAVLCVFLCALTFSPAIANISAAVALILWGTLCWRSRRNLKDLLPPAAARPLGIFLGLVLVSAVFSEYPSASLRGLEKIFKQILIFLMVYDIFRVSGRLKKFQNLFLALCWVVLVNALAQYIFGRDFIRFKTPEDSGAGVRLSGSLGSYGKLAAFLVIALPYLAGIFFSLYQGLKGRSKTILAAVTSVGLALVLFWTRSRGGILALGLAVFVMLVIYRKFLLLFLFLSLGITAVSFLPTNMVIHLDADLKEQSLVERFYLWDRAVHVISAKPLTGTGINTYAVAHQKYDRRQNWRVRNYYAHNGYLQFAAETGLPCLAALLWLLGSLLTGAIKRISIRAADAGPRLGLAIGIIGFLIFSLVDTVFQSAQPVLTFWFLMGILAAYTYPAEPVPVTWNNP